MAARCDVGIGVVVQRYLAGYSLLVEFLLQEAGDAPASRDLLPKLRAEAEAFDDVVDCVIEEYEREREHCFREAEYWRLKRVKRLLAGDVVDVAQLEYEFDAWHVGVTGVGPGLPRLLRGLAATLGCRLLMLNASGDAVWAWFARDSGLETVEWPKMIESRLLPGVALSIGEPGFGLPGWRLTHQQARSALEIARRGGRGVIRYADTILLSAALQDRTFLQSLWNMYVLPICDSHDGEKLCHTAKAYFAGSRNVSSTAAALGVSRPTVKSRLNLIEQRVGRQLESCAAEMETALHLLDICGDQAPDLQISESAFQSGKPGKAVKR
jgi:hypothetical protein